MRTRFALVALLWQFAGGGVASAENIPYLGQWSNGRGETLQIKRKTLQFADNKPVPYRDVTESTDGLNFELRITARGEVNAFSGKTLGLYVDGGPMKMTGYLSHADYVQKRNPQQVISWEPDDHGSGGESDDNAAAASPRPGSARRAYTPAVGSTERKAIALALHEPCARDLKQEVIVKFDLLRVEGDWAVARVQPLPAERKADRLREDRLQGANGGRHLRRCGGSAPEAQRRQLGRPRMALWRDRHGNGRVAEASSRPGGSLPVSFSVGSACVRACAFAVANGTQTLPLPSN